MTRPAKDPPTSVEAEAVHEELGELEDPRGDRPHIAFQGLVPALAGQPGIHLPNHPDTRRGGGDDHVEAIEDAHETTGESRGLAPVSAVRVELPAARLRIRELHLMAEALEEPDGGLPYLRKDRVADARDEQGDAHATLSAGRPAPRRRRR